VKMPEAPPRLIEPMAAWYKTGPPLAKVEPTSDVGSTSAVVYLRRGKNCCAISNWERGVGTRERNNSAGTTVGKAGGGGGAPGSPQ